MAHRSPTASSEARILEVLDRVEAARAVCDAALLGGSWFDAKVLDGVSDLVHQAARWAELVEMEW